MALGNDFSWGRQSTKKTAGFGLECATFYINMRVKHLYLLVSWSRTRFNSDWHGQVDGTVVIAKALKVDSEHLCANCGNPM